MALSTTTFNGNPHGPRRGLRALLASFLIAGVVAVGGGIATGTQYASAASARAGGSCVHTPWTHTLSLGNRGRAVRDLQRCLRYLGYNIKVDGRFGIETRAAVKRYQRRHHLRVDGIVGKHTWGSIGLAAVAKGLGGN